MIIKRQTCKLFKKIYLMMFKSRAMGEIITVLHDYYKRCHLILYMMKGLKVSFNLEYFTIKECKIDLSNNI